MAEWKIGLNGLINAALTVLLIIIFFQLFSFLLSHFLNLITDVKSIVAT
jgi:hypothetical protein